MVYTRVFCMIVVREQISADRKPFDCVAFVCDSRQAARNLTYALATAFQVIILIIINTVFIWHESIQIKKITDYEHGGVNIGGTEGKKKEKSIFFFCSYTASTLKKITFLRPCMSKRFYSVFLLVNTTLRLSRLF